MNQRRNIFLYLLFSVLAAVLIIIMVIFTPSNSPFIPVTEKIGVAGIFILCCLFGISFAIRPNWVRRSLQKTNYEENHKSDEEKRPFQGHHPNCPTFKNHTVLLHGKTWCAGCLGLLLGICASVLFMILYTLINFTFTKMISYVFLGIGLFFLSTVYLEVFYRRKHPMIHVFSNSLLPSSFLLVTIAVEATTGNVLFGFFSIVLGFLWLDTRIQLSNYRHRQLCSDCPKPCKMYTVAV